MAGFAGIYSNASSNPWTQDPEYDASKYQYGGYSGGAAQQATAYQNQAANAATRTAPTIGGTQLDQSAADQSRGFQMGSLASLQNAANGTAPSQAAILGQQMADKNAQAAVSAAGTVRGGPGAQASAYRYAANQAATQGAQAQQSIMADRASEMATAQNNLANAATSARGQDLSAATTNAQLGEQTQQTNAADALQQQGLNDQRSATYDALGNQVNEDQLNAGMQEQQTAAAVRQNADQLNQQTNQANTNTNKGIFSGVLGAVGGGLSAVGDLFSSSDPATKTLIMGSLAGLGLGGQSDDGAVDLGDSSGRIGLNASTGLAGKQPIPGMVGGGGIVGGVKPVGEGSVASPAMMTSDPQAKEPTSSDPPILGAIFKGLGGGNPYERSREFTVGVAGAPKGYASGRATPEDDKTSWSKPSTWGMNKKTDEKSLPSTEGQAPGQDDWNRYGAPEETTLKKGSGSTGPYVSTSRVEEGDVDWSNGGSIARPAEKPSAWTILGGIGRGLGGAPAKTKTSTESTKDGEGRPKGWGSVLSGIGRGLMTSDPAAKEKVARSAYLAGRTDAALSHDGQEAPFRYAPPGDDEEMFAAPGGQPELVLKDSSSRRPVESDDDNEAEEVEFPDGGAPPGPHALPPPMPPFQPRGTRNPITFYRDKTTSDPQSKNGFQRVSDDAMADAMRSMKPSVYAYKPDFASANGQARGEVNVGPMADEMAANPVARTAIVRDPRTGLLAIDKTKAEKVIMGSLAALQHQIDSIDEDTPKKRRRSGTRYTEAER